MTGSVLFVSNTSRLTRPYLDPSTRYRCFNLVQELSRRGIRAACSTQKLFEENVSRLSDFDRYIFHRPSLSESLVKFLLPRAGSRAIVADFDDLIFDVSLAEHTPAVRVRGEPSFRVRNALAANYEATSLCGQFSASTTSLKRRLEALFPGRPAHLFPNALDPGYVGIAHLIRKRVGSDQRKYRFGYFAGTISHDRDLASIAPAIEQALLADPSARMLVMGPIEISHELRRVRHQIVQRKDVVPFHALPSVMVQCETVLAPLEDTHFNDAKSGLKFFEAALVGCNVIATTIPDIDRFDYPFIRKCKTPQEWSRAMSTTFEIKDTEREALLKQVEQEVSIETIASNWLKVYMQ